MAWCPGPDPDRTWTGPRSRSNAGPGPGPEFAGPGPEVRVRGPQKQAGPDLDRTLDSLLTVKEKVNKVLNLLKSFKLTHHFLLKPLRWKYEHHGRIFWVQYLQTRQEDGID